MIGYFYNPTTESSRAAILIAAIKIFFKAIWLDYLRRRKREEEQEWKGKWLLGTHEEMKRRFKRKDS